MNQKPYSAFVTTLWLTQLLARHREGLTVGEVVKEVKALTKAQVSRCLDGLVSDGYLSVEVKPHGRTGKKQYRLTEAYAMECADIVRNYHDHYN